MKFSKPVAARSKKWDCGLWLGGIMGLIPAEDLETCLLWVMWVVKQRSLSWS